MDLHLQELDHLVRECRRLARCLTLPRSRRKFAGEHQLPCSRCSAIRTRTHPCLYLPSVRPKRQKDIVREGWAYHVSRWPLLVSPPHPAHFDTSSLTPAPARSS